MQRLYSDLSSPYGLASNLTKFTNHFDKLGYSKKQAKTFLLSQQAYSLHRPVVRKFKRRKYTLKGINDLIQLDLADMTSLSTFNDGVKFLLIFIDTFSKFLKVLPLKNKNAITVARALSTMLRENPPKNIQTDKGKEFINKEVKQLMDYHNINFYTTEDPDTKAAIAERVIRTLKGKIYRYVTYTGSNRYIDVLQQLVTSYNNTKHRTIGMAPADVTLRNSSYIKSKLNPPEHKTFTFSFEVGQPVRIALEKTAFSRGYTPNWSKEIFYISHQQPTNPETYKIQAADGEPILGSYYRQELQGVQPSVQNTL
jgi:hypothetical protein